MMRAIGFASILLGLMLLPGEAIAGEILSSPPITQIPANSPEVVDSLRLSAEMMARDLGISVEEAIARLQQQELISELNAQLEQNEADTFAGLWIQQEPNYRIVVAFTQNGEETIRPYVANSPLADLIDVRSAQATYTELQATQETVYQQLSSLGLAVDSAINIQENRVEVYVTDRALFDATLRRAKIQLPKHVETITLYQPLGENPPFPVTPDPSISLPQLRTRSGSFMTALMQGELIVQNGCLRVRPEGSAQSHLIIWQPDYFLHKNGNAREILDRSGRVVARVGEPIWIGGGEIPVTSELQQQLRSPIPQTCEGPYWLMGDIVPLMK